MATLQIHLEDELKERVAIRVNESGFKMIEEYVEAIVAADADQEFSDDDLEQFLLQRLESGPSIEMTPTYMAQLERDLEQRRQ